MTVGGAPGFSLSLSLVCTGYSVCVCVWTGVILSACLVVYVYVYAARLYPLTHRHSGLVHPQPSRWH